MKLLFHREGSSRIYFESASRRRPPSTRRGPRSEYSGYFELWAICHFSDQWNTILKNGWALVSKVSPQPGSVSSLPIFEKVSWIFWVLVHVKKLKFISQDNLIMGGFWKKMCVIIRFYKDFFQQQRIIALAMCNG